MVELQAYFECRGVQGGNRAHSHPWPDYEPPLADVSSLKSALRCTTSLRQQLKEASSQTASVALRSVCTYLEDDEANVAGFRCHQFARPAARNTLAHIHCQHPV